MIYLISALIFLFGLCIGSFLNSLIYRLETKKKICFARSICVYCKKILSWKELIPIISFLIQEGRCRKCKKKIFWQYPAVELVTGLLFVATFLKFWNLKLACLPAQAGSLEFGVWSLLYWFAISVLTVIFVYDLKHTEIPDKVMIPGIVVVFILQLILKVPVWDLLLAGAIGGGFFLIQYLASKGKWIGAGDVRLGIFMGFVLSWPNILVGLFIAYMIGAVIGIILVFSDKKKLQSQIAFGPFLAVGTIIAIFFGDFAVSWYLTLI